MKNNKLLYLFLFFILIAHLLVITGSARGFTLITAQEAYDMLNNGTAVLIDVRTLEEFTFTGSPSLEPNGDPIGYLIQWKLFDGIDDNGYIKFKNNSDFDNLINQTFGNNKDQSLILMCACGIRSSYAAERLEQLGFNRVYEIDNILKEMSSYPGGNGGFQGDPYSNLYNGYKGYPGRLEIENVETVTGNIDDENDSVSWMDTGLPITHQINIQKIPKIPEQQSSPQVNNQSGYNPFFSFSNPAFTNFFSPFNSTMQIITPFYSFQNFQTGNLFPFGQYYSGTTPQNLSTPNRPFSQYLYLPTITQTIPGQPAPYELNCKTS